jgi:Tol biopolymer transport system component
MAILENEKGCKGIRKLLVYILFLVASLLLNSNLHAQYFGRNKPGYRSFHYEVVRTPHFEIYHYLKNDSLIDALSRWSEKWYKIHQYVFKDTFKTRNPIIFYNSHADFQQTNAVSSLIGTGTGGVTESLKRRVIMPVGPSLAQTDHTLGHELVHAFQYHLLSNPDSLKHYNLNNVPTWMIEGMAEYLSLGSVDPYTTMWMRDAVWNNDFPTLQQLSTDTRYFPYRYGQAFWAMAGKIWGDTIIVPLLEKTAQSGFDQASISVLGFDEKTLSSMWKSATEVNLKKYFGNRTDTLIGKEIISEKNGGRINVSPSLSPDGKYVAFFSEKNLFTLDLYLAEAGSGKIIKKLSSVVKNNEIDDFSFIESAGTWSPDGKRFAFVVLSKGLNKLAILDVKKAKIKKEIIIPGVRYFSNPAWSPDGKKIVVTGLVDGICDLYLYNLQTSEVQKLTDDFPSNLLPAWSADGNFIVYSQEKIIESPDKKKFSFYPAIIDLKTNKIKKIDVFRDAYNMNPCFSSDDNFLYFLSDADGFRDLYKYDLRSGTVYRLTNFITGISGITDFSPALSISPGHDLLLYNYYFKGGYQIVIAREDQFHPRKVSGTTVDFDPGTLPPLKHVSENLVDTILYNSEKIKQLPVDSIREVKYKPKFKLDYISNSASIGISTGIYRNNLGGSINAIFSDMVGNNQLFTSLSLNGQIYDFAGQFAYINQKGKIKWGAAVSHIPYLTGGMFLTSDSIDYQDTRIPVDNLVIDYLRMFEDNVTLFGAYPLSQTRRFEASGSASWYYYRIDRYNNYYTLDGTSIGGNREKIPAPPGDNFRQLSLAYVEDNSFFGMTSPMEGHRARYQVEKYFGSANIYTTLIDYRRYFYLKPIGLAFRFYNYGMYGRDAESGVIPPLYLGYPWLIRGYENAGNNASSLTENNFNISWLNGSKIAVANAEIRLPFTGPERLALIKSKYLLTDLNLFFDSGLAWNSYNKVRFDYQPTSSNDDNVRFPVYSTGVSLRINVFGYLVLEPFYAFPLQNGGFRNGTFGLNFVPGW